MTAILDLVQNVGISKYRPGTQEMVRTGNPNERAKEMFFYQSCFNSNIHLSFNALKVIKYAKKYKNCSKKCTFFLKSCPKFNKLLKMEKVAQKLPSRICLGLDPIRTTIYLNSQCVVREVPCLQREYKCSLACSWKNAKSTSACTISFEGL